MTNIVFSLCFFRAEHSTGADDLLQEVGRLQIVCRHLASGPLSLLPDDTYGGVDWSPADRSPAGSIHRIAYNAAGKLAWLYTWWRHQMEMFSALLVIYPRLIPPSPVNSPHKGQWRGALKFSMICVWINDWVNNREAGDLIRHRSYYDVIIMIGGLPVCVLSQISSHETGHRPPIICTGDWPYLQLKFGLACLRMHISEFCLHQCIRDIP